MRRIDIVTDSGSDLSAETCAQYGITLVPLIVRFGTETYLEGQLGPAAFWRKVAESGTLPETSQPSTGMFEEAFRPLIGRGQHVLCMAITGAYSGTVNAAHAAARAFPDRVTVFDTQSLSLGQGYQVLQAARAAAAGEPLESILDLVRSLRDRTQLFIGLDTIENLRRGGRAAALIPLLEKVMRVLNIKPLLRMTDGELSVLGVTRSTSKLIQRIRQEVARRAPLQQLLVGHTCRPDLANVLAGELAEVVGIPRKAVLMVEVGAALACHAGSGVLAAGVITRQ